MGNATPRRTIRTGTAAEPSGGEPMTVMASERRRWERDAIEANRRAAREGRSSGHPDIDRRVLELARITVARIDENPALVQIGLDNIERWTRQKGGYLPRCHAEWKQLIEAHPWERLREMLLEESDEGQRLRSSHPFTGLVTEQERRRIYGPATACTYRLAAAMRQGASSSLT